jgi:lipopolysaccharide/colanic/teichoic acid biosynthesis glycosyltransferase
MVERQLGRLLVGPLARLATIVEEIRPDRIVIALADRRGRLPVQELLQARVQGIAIEDGVQFYERLTGKIAIEALTPYDLISSPDFRKSHVDLAFGHALSLLVSLVALVFLLPLFALIALAIKLDSPGPVFFVQNRVGLRGRPLRLLKFRTMHPVDRPPSEWACDNGDRITRAGYWLRRYRLDELPQLVNVLRGEMNLVGPRPHPACNVELFKQNIPYYWLRSVVRPGLTGWAQVRQGYANGLEEETEKMRHDLYYIKHMSAWLDLRILFSTVQTILSGHGSSEVADHISASPVSVPAVRGLRLTPASRRTVTSG